LTGESRSPPSPFRRCGGGGRRRRKRRRRWHGKKRGRGGRAGVNLLYQQTFVGRHPSARQPQSRSHRRPLLLFLLSPLWWPPLPPPPTGFRPRCNGPGRSLDLISEVPFTWLLESRCCSPSSFSSAINAIIAANLFFSLLWSGEGVTGSGGRGNGREMFALDIFQRDLSLILGGRILMIHCIPHLQSFPRSSLSCYSSLH
jgi:hypothetical protein